MTEHLLTFNRQKNPEEFSAYLVFIHTDNNGENGESEVAISGGDDITRVMKWLLQKQWEKFLPKHVVSQGVLECELEGIRMEGRKEKGSFETLLHNGFNRHHIRVNEQVMVDESKEKLLKVRDFVLSL